MDRQTNQQRFDTAYSSFNANEPTKTRRLFVGGLMPDVTESHLYDYFRKFGVLTECEIPHTIRGKKKKFGYVSFLKKYDAESILQMPHEILGSKVQLEFALSTVEIFHEQLRKSKCKLFVSGDLIASLDPAVIYREISAFGHVEKVKKLRTDKKSFNSCFVTMKTVSDAEFLLQQKSLVLPILQKVTFKRFVPRGRSEQEETLDPFGSVNHMLEQAEGLETFISSDFESQRLLTKNTLHTKHRSAAPIRLRPGLMIGATHSPTNTYLLGDTLTTYLGVVRPLKAKLISLEEVDLQIIQNSEQNLRYNISISRPVFTYKGAILQH